MSKNLKFIGFKCDPDLRLAVERASSGQISRYIREAVFEKLKAMGHEIENDAVQVPSRIGKGGRPKKSKPMNNSRI